MKALMDTNCENEAAISTLKTQVEEMKSRELKDRKHHLQMKDQDVKGVSEAEKSLKQEVENLKEQNQMQLSQLDRQREIYEQKENELKQALEDMQEMRLSIQKKKSEISTKEILDKQVLEENLS